MSRSQKRPSDSLQGELQGVGKLRGQLRSSENMPTSPWIIVPCVCWMRLSLVLHTCRFYPPSHLFYPVGSANELGLLSQKTLGWLKKMCTFPSRCLDQKEKHFNPFAFRAWGTGGRALTVPLAFHTCGCSVPTGCKEGGPYRRKYRVLWLQCLQCLFILMLISLGKYFCPWVLGFIQREQMIPLGCLANTCSAVGEMSRVITTLRV